jgi:hypothetical protein
MEYTGYYIFKVTDSIENKTSTYLDTFGRKTFESGQKLYAKITGL